MTKHLSALFLLPLSLAAVPHGSGPPPAGGSWGGPGDTVPSGPGPSGPGAPVPSTPAPSGPATGGSSAPSSPAPVPASTGQPLPGSTGGVRGPAPTTGAQVAPDPTSWETWWFYNRHAYFDLKGRADSNWVRTRDDGAPSVDPVDRGIAAMLKALEQERQRDLLSSLIIALARACDGEARVHAPAIAAKLLPFLADPDQEVAETAAVALGILMDEGSIPTLAAVLHDEPAGRKVTGGSRVSLRTRAFAAYALGLCAARSEREDLRVFATHHLQRELIGAGDAAAADLPAACVIALGLVPLAESADEAAREILVRGPNGLRAGADLRPGTREAAIAQLAELLRDRKQHAFVRAHAPDAMARLAADGSPALRDTVTRELIESVTRDARGEMETARGAVQALGRLGDADDEAADVRVRAALQRALQSPDLQTRLYAMISAAQVATRRGLAEDPAAVEVEAQKALLERLTRGRSRERAWAALALGVLEHGRAARGAEGSTAVRGALRRELSDASSSEEIAVLSLGLGLAGDRGAAPLLLFKLEKTGDPRARGHIATALGMLGVEEARLPLRAILAGARFQSDLLRETAIALVLLGDAEVAPALIESLRAARSLASQAACARALGFAGNLAAVDPLVRMLEDRTLTAGARAFVAVALGMVCDRERVPWNARISIGVNYRAAPPSLADGTAGILDIL